MPNLFWSSRDQRPYVNPYINEPGMSDPIQSEPPAGDLGKIYDRADADERVDQLLLVCAAMWELLSEKTALSENDLVDKIAEMDARDGTADGKLTPAPVQCPNCQRTIFPKQRRCLYCGTPRPAQSVFKKI